MRNKSNFLGEDVTVVDLADESASFCSKLLADFGARVIKVAGRRSDAKKNVGFPEYSFFYHNLNKTRLILDVNETGDREILRELIAEADVFVETSPPGYLRKLNLSYSHLRRTNPGLIHASITPFGQTGPKSHYRSCDSIAAALGGHSYVSGTTYAPPIKLSGPQSSYSVSLFGAVAILLALRKRRLTGRGQYLDLSTQEALVSTLEHVMVSYFNDGTITERRGSTYRDNLFTILPCKDGHVLLTILQNWDTILELMISSGNVEDLTEDRWQDQAYREKHFDHVMEVVARWTKNYTKESLFELGQAMRFPWAPVHTPFDVLRSPQLSFRRFFVKTELSRNNRSVLLPGLPYKFSSFSPRQFRKECLFEANGRSIPAALRSQLRKKRETGATKDNLTRSPMKGGVLNGIRVLDFTWMLAGPYATRILADFGAEVIKIQSKKTAKGAEENSGYYFRTWNRNKRSITVDLSRPEARDIVVKLAAMSDIVVENFSPRVMANCGLTYQRLKEAKCDIIMASISAMGQTGPWKDFVGFGPTFHALSGLVATMSRVAGEPVCPGFAYGDTVTGLYAVLAILAALAHRHATGEGQYIDVSGYEAMCSVLGPALAQASAEQEEENEQETICDESVPASPHGCYPCLGDDKWVAIAVFSEEEWQTFCRIVGDPALKGKRFSDTAKRRQNHKELDLLIRRWTISHSPRRIVQLLQEAGIAAASVLNAEELAKDNQLRARRFFVRSAHPVLGETISDRSPLSFGRKELQPWKPAPFLGEANHYVFSELLGLSPSKIASLSEKGVIG